MESTKISVVARFPQFSFLENVASRQDGSILITDAVTNCLWYVPAQPTNAEVEPKKIYGFDQSPMGIVEVVEDVFYITSFSQNKDRQRSKLWKLDMRGFQVDAELNINSVLDFPQEAHFLNGSAVLSPNVILCADSWLSSIWRVAIPDDGGPPSAKIWLRHSTFAHSSDPAKPDVPGVNGLKYNSTDNNVYFTTTAQTIFGRVPVDPVTFDPAGEPKEVTARWMWADDLLVDETRNLAYVTTHRQNTIECIDLSSGSRTNLVGEPLNADVVGPTAGCWGHGAHGRIAYFTTDGGIKRRVDGVVQQAHLMKVEFDAS